MERKLTEAYYARAGILWEVSGIFVFRLIFTSALWGSMVKAIINGKKTTDQDGDFSRCIKVT